MYEEKCLDALFEQKIFQGFHKGNFLYIFKGLCTKKPFLTFLLKILLLPPLDITACSNVQLLQIERYFLLQRSIPFSPLENQQHELSQNRHLCGLFGLLLSLRRRLRQHPAKVRRLDQGEPEGGRAGEPGKKTEPLPQKRPKKIRRILLLAKHGTCLC